MIRGEQSWPKCDPFTQAYWLENQPYIQTKMAPTSRPSLPSLESLCSFLICPARRAEERVPPAFLKQTFLNGGQEFEDTIYTRRWCHFGV